MKRIGLDTNAIGYCLANNISAAELKQFLQMQNLVPVVCPYVSYELSRTFLGNIATAKALFSFISELNPQYIAPREILYLREFYKLDKNSIFSDLADESTKKQMLIMIEAHAAGNITEELNNFVNGRQDFLRSTRYKNFKPSRSEKEKIDKYKNSSEAIEALFLKIKEEDTAVIKCFQDIISNATNNKIQLSDKHILKLVQNIFDYKALRSLIRNVFHLHFLTHKNGDVPREDRLTDGLVVVEYSYCDQILSHDAKLVETHAQAINPDVFPIMASEFLKNLIRLPN
jgi:hypothetical protein